ncbi:unnamed protein product [Fraxinus pennsylvanica]|uniref:No apical meristem-associated C-terminal domain-containing protein n=1 Tax=Fraxinus pennsylvanica TaxID=56036 RepID=A0AAD2DKS6_9LAMI|nr:unnamed protein product [Fraxinus pennsylvanica]
MKPASINQSRSKRSLQARMRVILNAVDKLRGCVRQVENFNSSGASEQDILYRAKTLLTHDKNYKKGFKFDHVWPILKDIEKFRHDVHAATSVFQVRYGNFASSPSESPTSVSPRLSSFSLIINEENVVGTSTERPSGAKKAKNQMTNVVVSTSVEKKNGEESSPQNLEGSTEKANGSQANDFNIDAYFVVLRKFWHPIENGDCSGVADIGDCEEEQFVFGEGVYEWNCRSCVQQGA